MGEPSGTRGYAPCAPTYPKYCCGSCKLSSLAVPTTLPCVIPSGMSNPAPSFLEFGPRRPSQSLVGPLHWLEGSSLSADLHFSVGYSS